MAMNYRVEIDLDDTRANQQIAQLNQQIARIGQGSNPAAGVTSLNQQLQRMIANNPALSNVIRSLGQTGTTSQSSSGAVAALVAQLRALGATNAQIQAIGAQLGNIGNSARQSGGMLGALGASAQSALSHVAGMGGAMAGIATAGAALGVTAGVAAFAALGTAAVSASAQMESYRASLTTVLGSADLAGQAMDRLTKFAAKTPFSLQQSVEGFIQLKALGLDPSERAMTSYGNTASALGKELSQMVEAVADATTGEFERLKTFGITTKTEGDKVKLTFAGVTTTVGKNAAEIQEYLIKLGETRFGDAMSKQLLTFNGALSGLGDTWFQTLAAIGDGGLTKSIASVINLLSDGLTTFTPLLSSIGNVMGGLVSGVVAVIKGIGSVFSALNAGTSSVTFLEGLTFAFNVVGQTAEVVGTIIGGVLGGVGTAISGVSNLLRDAFGISLDWLGVKFDSSSRSWTNSIIGILRAAKAVAMLLPKVFQIAVNDLMGMFSTLGRAIGALLSGNWELARELANKKLFTNTERAVKAVGEVGVKTYNDKAGADRAWNKMLGRTDKKDSNANFGGGAAKPTPPDAKKEKDDAAKKAAERLKRENEFWQVLKSQAITAGMLPQQAELYNKEIELRRILGDGELKDSIQLNAEQKKRIAGLLAEKDLNEVLKQAKEGIQSADIEAQKIQSRIAATTGVTAEKAAENLAIEEKLWPIKQAALLKGVSLADAELQRQLAILEAKERQNYAAERANQLAREAAQRGTDYATAAIETDGTKAQKIARLTSNRDKTLADLRAAKASGEINADAFEAGVKRATREFEEAMRAISNSFAHRLGDALADIGSRIGGKLGNLLQDFGGIADGIGDFDKSAKSITDKISKLFGDGDKSPFVQGLSKAVGQAVAGAEIGAQVGDAMKSLGIKTSQTGAKIGGAIGGMTGNPLIAAGASIVGGLVGNLFKKSKYGTASLTGYDPASITANKSKYGEAAIGAAESVQDGLRDIAQQLGGQLGSFSLAIGKYKDNWRVRDDAWDGKLNFKGQSANGLHDFGDDEDAAIAYAIKNAISDGAITGLSKTVQGFLKNLDVDAAIDMAQQFADAMNELAAMKNPVAYAIGEIQNPLNTLRDTLKATGGDLSDLAKIEELRVLKLNDLLKQQTQTFTDLMDRLKGEGTGVTALSRLNSDLAKLDVFKADIAAGKQVNQDDFASLVDQIMGESSSVWGTATEQGQAIRKMLMETVSAAEQLVRNEFSLALGANDNSTSAAQDTTSAAIIAGNAAVTQRIDNTNTALALNNAYQEKILEALQSRSNVVDLTYERKSRMNQV